jgi:hypothetical protein
VSIATVAIGATYDFHIVSLQAMYEYRAKLNAPTVLNYLLTIVSSALLPFAFAGFVTQKAYWRAAAVLAVLLTLYPIAFNKVAILTPLWLVTVLILSHLLEARLVTILSLLAPILAGMLLILAFGSSGALVFATINFRMLTIPSVAMDIYNDFFAAHDLTYFCQISILKRMMPCPYQEPLSIVMQNAYGLGYFNASLFATEGIASVGPLFAPVPAFVCGLVIALANRLSAGLSPRFILISGAVFAQTLLNVPMTTTLLTHGLAILLLLWYLTPRSIFERNASSRTADRPEIHTR